MSAIKGITCDLFGFFLLTGFVGVEGCSFWGGGGISFPSPISVSTLRLTVMQLTPVSLLPKDPILQGKPNGLSQRQLAMKSANAPRLTHPPGKVGAFRGEGSPGLIWGSWALPVTPGRCQANGIAEEEGL